MYRHRPNMQGFSWKDLTNKAGDLIKTGTQTVSTALPSSVTNVVSQAGQKIEDLTDVTKYIQPYVNDLKQEYIKIRDQYLPNLITKAKNELTQELQTKVVPKAISFAKQEVPKLVQDATKYVDNTIKPKVEIVMDDAKKVVKTGIIIVGAFCGLTLLIQLGILITLIKNNRRR